MGCILCCGKSESLRRHKNPINLSHHVNTYCFWFHKINVLLNWWLQSWRYMRLYWQRAIVRFHWNNLWKRKLIFVGVWRAFSVSCKNNVIIIILNKPTQLTFTRIRYTCVAILLYIFCTYLTRRCGVESSASKYSSEPSDSFGDCIFNSTQWVLCVVPNMIVNVSHEGQGNQNDRLFDTFLGYYRSEINYFFFR